MSDLYKQLVLNLKLIGITHGSTLLFNVLHTAKRLVQLYQKRKSIKIRLSVLYSRIPLLRPPSGPSQVALTGGWPRCSYQWSYIFFHENTHTQKHYLFGFFFYKLLHASMTETSDNFVWKLVFLLWNVYFLAEIEGFSLQSGPT